MKGLTRVIIAAGLLLAGCSSSGDTTADSAPTSTERVTETTAVTTTAPTTAAPTQIEESTTTAETTTTTDPSPYFGPAGTTDLGEWSEDEREIIHSGHIYWDLIIRSINVDQANPADPDYVVWLNGATQQRLRDAAAETLASGRTTQGVAILQPISVTIDGTTAELLECVLDAVDTLDADGVIIEPADLEPSLWRTTIKENGPVWQTIGFARVDGTCDLDESLAQTVPFATN